MSASGMISVSTDSIESRHRTDFWRSLSAPFYDVSPVVDGQVIEGRLASRLLGSFMVGKRQFDARENLRDRARVAQGDMDGYQLELFLDGSLTGDCDGTDMRLDPGDIGVFDYARPHRTRQTAGTSLMLYMPRDRVDAATGGRSVHGTVLRAHGPGTRLVASILHGLADVMPDMPDRDAMTIDSAMIDLIAASIAGQQSGTEDSAGAVQRILQREILAFIRANLADPDLGPDMLVYRFRISRAHLYRMFPGHGGVARLIREERLKHAWRDLHRHRSRAITAIAYDYGFSSGNQFLRAFRARYGLTPSQARQQPGPVAACTGVAGLATHIARSAAHHLSAQLPIPLPGRNGRSLLVQG